MQFFAKSALVAAALIATNIAAAQADDSADVAREAKVPVAVVDNVLSNVDAFFASPDAPANRMTSGVIKELALKTIKSRLSNLSDATPGKALENSVDDRNATYRVAVRTTRHDVSEASDCVENKVAVTASEGVPVVKDGAFTFDMVHPRLAKWEWALTFCRAPIGNGDFSDWKLSSAAK